jgi:hypothetical protein
MGGDPELVDTKRERGFARGTAVVLYLHSPREKVWGVLLSLEAAGIVVRGLDLAAFEDWARQEARGEQGIGATTLFYPMHRLERMERDESIGPVVSCAERFERQVGRSAIEAVLRQ